MEITAKKDTLDKSLNFALEASAGTGKTYQLSMRVAGMLLIGVPLHDILCLTFTNKANDETLERIVSTLSRLAEGKADDNQTESLVSLMKKYGKGKKTEYSVTDLQNDAKTARDILLEEFSSLKIKTIDSFCNSILKLFPFEAQLRPDYAICSESEDDLLREEAFYNLMETLLKNPDWQKLFSVFADTMEQNKSTAPETLLKYATFASLKRIELKLPLNKTPLPPEKILTALYQAQDERKGALDKIHTLADILTARNFGDRRDKTVATLKEIKEIKDAIKSTLLSAETPADHGYFKKTEFSETELQLHSEIKEAVGRYLSLKGDIAKSLALVLGGSLYGELKTLKNEKNVLTYADIGERVFDILVADKKNIDKDYLYFRLDAKINHILIDEFQDTSVPQWLILRPLAEEAMAGTGQYDKNGSFFYVGDPKQNLYRFRGGSSKLFDKVAQTYPERLTTETLDINYRSGKNIVEAVNTIFNKASDIIYGENAHTMFQINQKTPQERLDGYISIEHPLINDNENEKFTDFCLRQVKKAAEAGFSYADIAVLVPSNKDGFQIKEKLLEENIPVRLETSDKLDGTDVFRSLMGLALFIETGDEFAFLEFALTGSPAFDTSKYADKAQREQIKGHILKIAQSCGKKTIFEKILAVVKDTGLQNRFEKEPDFFQALDVMAASAGFETNVEEFISCVSSGASNRQSLTSGENKAVSVMTVHKSKGLQFPCVILPKLDFKLKADATGGSFVLTQEISGRTSFEFVHTAPSLPFLNSSEKEALDAENALVTQDALNGLYVAMTRAEEALIVMAEPPKEKETGNKNIARLLNDFITVPYQKGDLKPYGKKRPLSPSEYTLTGECRVLEEKTSIEKDFSMDYKSAAFGTALHTGAFLLNGSGDNLHDAFLGAVALSGATLDNKEKTQLNNYLKQLAANTHWQGLFHGSVFRERKVGMKGSLKSIDFYSDMGNKIVLIDYKTGEITPETLDKYKKQLGYYSVILKNIYQKNVEKFIYHFHEGKLEIINVA